MASQLPEPISIKLVVVGDGAVGKTSILLRYSQNRFPKDYEPTIFENSIINVKIDHNIVNLGLWDTAGQEEFARLRPLAYSNVDVFLIVYSVDDRASFSNAIKKWFMEVHAVSPKAVKLFVGNKIDLRSNLNIGGKLVTTREADDQFKRMRCLFGQCSALTRQGISSLFQKAVRQVIRNRSLSNYGAKLQQSCPACQLI